MILIFVEKMEGKDMDDKFKTYIKDIFPFDTFFAHLATKSPKVAIRQEKRIFEKLSS
jgi:hypothetical protein